MTDSLNEDKFTFLSRYGSMQCPSLRTHLASTDLKHYFEGLSTHEIDCMLGYFLVEVLWKKSPEERRQFGRGMENTIKFFGESVFEDEEDYMHFCRQQFDEMYGDEGWK